MEHPNEMQAFTRNGIKAAINLCHGASKAAGWWIDPKTGADDLLDPKTIPMKIALIHSELSEALEGHRKGKMDEHLPNRTSLEVELGDALIRIYDLAGAYNLDLSGAVLDKLAYNAQRADHKMENRQASGGKAD